MSKYFEEEQSKEFLLSDYLKRDASSFKHSIYTDSDRIKRTEYLISLLGDVPLSEQLYELFIIQFQRFGGKYDVRVRPDTIEGIYKITRKYPMLTISAIEEIWFRYIKDLFEDYSLTRILDKYLEVFGIQDETFELFMTYVDKKADELQKMYIEDSLQLEQLGDDYSKSFVDHLKYLILSKHYQYGEIKKYLPEASLVTIDEDHLIALSKQSRIFFGCCNPVSYTMLDTLLETQTLDSYPEHPTYYISTGLSEIATFTKQDFLDSIQKTKIKSLE
ncbi:MAG: hypothetical protein IJO63_00805 [Bacilli bacterium]|nr:hypothetical protein [Bacilli bacterium]